MNPIVRMMKRYINMPLKYALPLLFIGALVLTSTAGCANTTSTPTPPVKATVATAATPSLPQLSQTQLNAIQRDIEANGYNITQPLNQSGGIGTSANGSTFYKGAITKSPGIQYNFTIQYNLTVEVCKDNATANSQFSSTVTNLQKLGIVGSYNSPTQWSGTSTLNGIQVSSSATKSATGPPYTITTIE